MFQHGERTAFFHRIFRAFLFETAHAPLHRFQASGRTGEHGLFEGHIAKTAIFRLRQHGFIGDECFKRRLFFCGGSARHLADMPLFKAALRLILNIFLEATNEQALDVIPVILDVLLGVVIRVRNSGRIQHVHQAGKGTCAAVVRGGGQHNQCIAPAGKQIRQAGTLGTAVASLGHIMRLIDDNNIPAGILQMDTVFTVPLDRVDGNDGFVIVMERIMVAGQIPTDTLNLGGIQADQRNGKTLPHFLLELGHHALDGHNENTTAFSTSDQLTNQNTGFQRFTKTDTVRHQDTLTGTGEAHSGGLQLIRHHVHDGVMADVQLRIGRDLLPPEAFQEKARPGKPSRAVRYQRGFRGVDHRNLF